MLDLQWLILNAQTVWMQDFPLRDKPIAHDCTATDFPATFQNVLKAADVEPALDAFLCGDVSTDPHK
jgi:hypothetical protein